jgi:tRNA A37 threonylcarbamoyladenosine dehydratase
MRYFRSKILFKDDFKILQKSKIIILGVGGIGGHVLDCLYRSGITDITIVDFDSYETSNQNRQIGSDIIGNIKVHRLKKLYPKIIGIEKKIDFAWIDTFDMSPYDLILDAIDDIRLKVKLIKKYYKKMISTSGGAKRVNPIKIEYIDIFKTYNDPFIKCIRDDLKKEGFKKSYKIIFSSELPQCDGLGSFIGVTGSFGLAMCSVAIEKIRNSIKKD